MSKPGGGLVYFVGAGPGDPGLMTVKGSACLRRADLVLYDYLVNPAVLQGVKSGSRLVCLGQHGTGRLLTPGEIVEQMVAGAREGKVVCRLKSGDPLVFARAREELEGVERAGIPYEVVPGVTAALASGAYAGIPLTDRDSAAAVALITARLAEDPAEKRVDYESLARFPGTLVFYMGVTVVREWSEGLMRYGKGPETPVALVRRCSFPDQQVWRTTLGEVASLKEELQLRPPVLAIVGEVAEGGRLGSWFMERPLFGKTILLARPREQLGETAGELERLGGEVVGMPAIEIGRLEDFRELDGVIERLGTFDWLVFSSANGVRYFFERLWELGKDWRAVGGLKLAAIGPATAAALTALQLRADVVPDEFRAEGLATALIEHCRGKRVLLARASRGREVLAEMLGGVAAAVEQVVVYTSTDVREAPGDVVDLLKAGKITCGVVSSSAIGKSLARLLGREFQELPLVSISPVTSGVLRELGCKQIAEATRHDFVGVVEVILREWGDKE